MSLKLEQQYSAPTDALWSALCTRAYWEGLLKSSASVRAQLLKFECDDHSLKVDIEKHVASKAPRFAQAFMGETVSMRHTEIWKCCDGSWQSSIVIDVDSGSASMSGKACLREEGQGAVYAITLTGEVDVPLVGKRLARMLEDGAKESLAADYAFTQRYLREHGWERKSLPQARATHLETRAT